MSRVKDVDFVFSWVDGSDPKHQTLRTRYLVARQLRGAPPMRQTRAQAQAQAQVMATPYAPGSDLHSTSYESCRWRSSGEINQSVKSVLKFAPWVRNIYVVCSLGQNPNLQGLLIPGHGQSTHEIVVIQDSDICPIVPVFNSHAIEANLHKIPGLAEKFVYMCDDMFLGSPVEKSFFFDEPTGKAKVLLGKTMQVPEWFGRNIKSRHPAWYCARINNFILLNHIYGKKLRRDTIHQAHALTKAAVGRAWSNPTLCAKLEKTCRSRFRSVDDVEPIGLFSWVGIETQLCVPLVAEAIPHVLRNMYVDIHDSCDCQKIAHDLKTKRPRLYCLNDTMVRPSVGQLRVYEKLLRTGLPHHI
jgi:hypothetical protein